MKEIELPDGRIAEFPDEMDNAAISAVLAKQFPTTPQQQQQPARQPASALKRALAGIADPGIGIAQIADRLVVNPVRQLVSPGASSMDDYVREREAGLKTDGFDAARMAGQVVSPLNYLPTGTTGTVASKLPSAQAALAGASQGAMVPATSNDFWSEKAGQVALGAGAGAAGHALARTLGGVVRPTAEARTLTDAGVALTPGQAAGAGSFVKRAEEQLASLPFAGHAIRGAQRRAVEEANVAAAQSVARMVDDSIKLGKPPREAIEQTRDAISEAYQQSLEGMAWPALALRNDLKASMAHLPTDLPLVPEATIQQIDSYFAKRLGPWVKQGGDLTGDQLKQVDAELGQMARHLANSPNPTDKVQAPAWREVQSYVRNAMENAQPDPAMQAKLGQANAAYRQLLALEKALLPGNEVFTPRRLSASLDRMGINSGDLRGISDAMKATLPNSVPDSGTAERLLTAGLPALLMGGGAGASGLGYDTLGAGMVAAGALGSRPGAKALTGAYRWQPGAEALVNALRRRAVPAIVGRSGDE